MRGHLAAIPVRDDAEDNCAERAEEEGERDVMDIVYNSNVNCLSVIVHGGWSTYNRGGLGDVELLFESIRLCPPAQSVRAAHVPCITNEDDTPLGRMGTNAGPGWTSVREERLWHAAEAVFFDGSPGGGLELRESGTIFVRMWPYVNCENLRTGTTR
jgi:hypothetical protein